MHTKTFKIGECCQGGIITVEIQGKNISIIGKEWDETKGFKKSSDQSKAKEFTRSTVTTDEYYAYNKIEAILLNLANHYWASIISEWIMSKVTLEEQGFYRQ